MRSASSPIRSTASFVSAIVRFVECSLVTSIGVITFMNWPFALAVSWRRFVYSCASIWPSMRESRRRIPASAIAGRPPRSARRASSTTPLKRRRT